MRAMTAIAIAATLSSCASYKGWEQVRIEHAKPSESCVYKVQEACSKPGAGCYEFYKKRATTYGANTVVITEEKDSQHTAFSYMSGRMRSSGGMAALADYYACPAP